jgi:multiple sugar transport system substrate-binding protein
MSTKTPQSPQPSAGLGRREWLKTTGAAAAVATGAGLGLFGGKAPAFAQQRELKVLMWSSFVKEADVEVDRQAVEFGKAEGIKVAVEHINNNDLPARGTAAVESGTGSDIIQVWENFPLLWESALIDHSDLVREAGGNSIYKVYRDMVDTGKGYAGVPLFGTGALYAYRKSTFQQAGVKAPATWDEFLTAGTGIKKLNMPVGQALGHSFGDPRGFCQTLLWSFGGKSVDEKARVIINSKETRRALEFLKEFWFAACDESGLAWDDSSNNRAFAANAIGCTRNGASIYFVANREFQQKGNPLVQDIGHFKDVKGPAGSRHDFTTYTMSIFKYSKVQTAAKNYVRYSFRDDNMDKLFLANGGYINPNTPKWENHSFWKQHPVLEPFKDLPHDAVHSAWPGPVDRRGSEAVAKYIVVDMFARAVKGDSVEGSLSIAENELKQIYKS